MNLPALHSVLAPSKPLDGSEGQGACSATSSWTGRTAVASHDLDFPEVRFPSRQMLEGVGEIAMRRLVRRHHDLLRVSEIGNMLPADKAKYEAVVNRISDFVIESCGGPANYTLVNGQGCLRTRHFPVTIDEAGRKTWLACLMQALDESEFPHALREEYWNWMEPLSIRMVNRRTEKRQPGRYPYNWFLIRVRHPTMAMCRR